MMNPAFHEVSWQTGEKSENAGTFVCLECKFIISHVENSEHSGTYTFLLREINMLLI